MNYQDFVDNSMERAVRKFMASYLSRHGELGGRPLSLLASFLWEAIVRGRSWQSAGPGVGLGSASNSLCDLGRCLPCSGPKFLLSTWGREARQSLSPYCLEPEDLSCKTQCITLPPET